MINIYWYESSKMIFEFLMFGSKWKKDACLPIHIIVEITGKYITMLSGSKGSINVPEEIQLSRYKQ